MVLNPMIEEHPGDHGRKGAYDQMEPGKVLKKTLIAFDGHRGSCDLNPVTEKIKCRRKQGSQMQENIKRKTGVFLTENMGQQDQVRRTADRKVLSGPLDQAVKNRFEMSHEVETTLVKA